MKISTEVLNVLGAARCEGNRLFLEGQLDRKLYQAVDAVLQASGGKWNRKERAHVFDGDAAAEVDQALATGEFRRVKQELGQFDSPPEVARMVIRSADIWPGLRVLEPSAGTGGLVMPALQMGAVVDAVEIDEKRRAVLAKLMAGSSHRSARMSTIQQRDFLEMEPPAELYPRIVMNPPFAPRQSDIDHVLHALRFLAPRGRLVAVMSASVEFRDNKKTVEFRKVVAEHNGSIAPLPAGAFATSGTMVNTCMVLLDKP